MSCRLTTSRIFSSLDFIDEGFDRPRWRDGSRYTTLRHLSLPKNTLQSTVGSDINGEDCTSSNTCSGSNSDLTSTTGSVSGGINTEVHEIILHDARSGEASTLVSYEQLIPPGETTPLAVDDYIVADDLSKVIVFTKAMKVWRLKTKGSYWILDLKESQQSCNSLRQLGVGLEPNSSNNAATELQFASFSPNLQYVAYVYKNNIFVENFQHHIRQLTIDGGDMVINGTFDWVYEEEFGVYDGFRWSPDSRSIAYWQIDQKGVDVVNLVNNTDSLYPKINSIPYPKCGETNPSARIGLVQIPDFASPSHPETLWIHFEDDNSRDNYIADMCFIEGKKSAEDNPKYQIVLQRLNRLQNALNIYSVWYDPNQPLFMTPFPMYEESSSAWIDVEKPLRWINLPTASGKGKNNYLLMLSEKYGWRQIILVKNNFISDERSEEIIITPEGLDVESISGYDETTNEVYFISSPDDPLRRYLYSASLSDRVEGGDTKAIRRITPTDANYNGTNGYILSKDARYAVHTFSSVERPTMTAIVSLPSHEVLCVLARNSRLWSNFQSISTSKVNSGIEQELVIPELEFFRVSIPNDVELDAWCLYPPKFDPSRLRAYPVIVYVYGEPAAQTVRDRWAGKIGIWHRMLAQRGAVVLSVDNRGTPALKGAAWRQHVYKNIGIRPSYDQAHALKSILASRPYLDPSRVAIWGWSGGGSMSLNMLFRYPDLYKTAVSVAPVPDMRLYDTIYQERYMARPVDNPTGYHDGSPIHHARYMRDDQNLLVIHGTGDDNCHYQGVECLTNELIKHNKQFRMFAYPNRSHSICEGANTTQHLFDMITSYLAETGHLSV